jgi:hypothetical protein
VKARARRVSPIAVTGEVWIRGWYEVIRRLPSAQCDAELTIWEWPICNPEIGDITGLYDPFDHVIAIARCPNPYDEIATVLHEVAHAASNQRHSRHHGYSWRRKYIAIAAELFSDDPLPVASVLTSGLRGRRDRREVLDSAILMLVTAHMPRLTVAPDGQVEAMVGGRTLRTRMPRRDPALASSASRDGTRPSL